METFPAASPEHEYEREDADAQRPVDLGRHGGRRLRPHTGPGEHRRPDALLRGAGLGQFSEHAGAAAERAFAAVRTDLADATRTDFYVMAGIMVAVYVLAHVWLPRDRVAQEQRVTRGAAG